jgi:ABC-type antimicrobial peptide transport system permease subunit
MGMVVMLIEKAVVMPVMMPLEICMAFMSWPFFGTASAPVRPRDVKRVSFAAQLNTAFANKPFMALLAVKFVQLFGLFTSTAMSFFIIKFVLGKDKPGTWMVIFLVVSTIAQVLTIPFWRKLSLAIFDRSFAVTTYLQAVAIAIGLVGIAASMSAQVLARRKEFGLLSHLGLTRAQVIGVVAGSTYA